MQAFGTPGSWAKVEPVELVRRSVLTRVGAGTLFVFLLGAGGCRDEAPGEQSEPATGTSADAGVDGSSDGLPTACVAGETRPCYAGPSGTQGLGICRSGLQTCVSDGSGWSGCDGEIVPEEAERCDTPEDDDCDGSSICEPRLRWAETIPASFLGAALDSQGHPIIAGATGFAEVQGVEIDGYFLLELDHEGRLLWVRNIDPGFGITIAGLEVTRDDGFVIAGHYQGEPDFGGGPLPLVGFGGGFVASYDGEGEHRWSRGDSSAPYTALALGPDDEPYVLGISSELVVVGHEPDGTRAWNVETEGTFGLFEDGTALAITEGGELFVAAVMGAVSDGASLGGGTLDLPEYGPLILRLDATGGLTGQRRPFVDEVPSIAGFELDRRADGTMQLVSNAYGPDFGQSIVVQRYDGALELVDELVLADDAWVMGAAPSPDGTTAFAIEFSDELELGPIGAGLPSFEQGVALAAVDGAGHGRWLELLHAPSGVGLEGLDVGPQGEVLVVGFVDGGAFLGGGLVASNFVALLDP